MEQTLTVAIIGLGDAGTWFARRLIANGVNVRGFDIAPSVATDLPVAATLADAVIDADVVISVNTATAALTVATQVSPHLAPGAMYVDANSGNPGLKQRMEAVFPQDSLVDVAIVTRPSDAEDDMALLASGPLAQRLADILVPRGFTVEVVSPEVGQAATRALTRSLVSTFIASALVDYMWAAQAVGLEKWAYEEMLTEFERMNGETAKKLLRDVVSNPKRREIEMLDIVEMLEAAGYHSLFVPPSQLVYNKVYHSIKVPFVEGR